MARAFSSVSDQTMELRLPGRGRIASGPVGMKYCQAVPLCGFS